MRLSLTECFIKEQYDKKNCVINAFDALKYIHAVSNQNDCKTEKWLNNLLLKFTKKAM